MFLGVKIAGVSISLLCRIAYLKAHRMFNLYYSNQLSQQKTLLATILAQDPNPDPFASEIILVQSLGMAQWLQRQLAESLGVSANIHFPYPTSFLWQQYRTLFPELPKENVFERGLMVWRIMRLLPNLLSLPEFAPLAFYLQPDDQLKRYQLSCKIADLFDQYLIYRPHWLIHWEKERESAIFAEISQSPTYRVEMEEEIRQSIAWQGILWNALVEEIRADSDAQIFQTSHRAYLQQRYFEKLDQLSEKEKARLPARIFVFGISALPPTQLAVLKKLSEHCHVHLFFTNPSEPFWGDQREDKLLEKLALNHTVSEEELASLLEHQGNPLLANWGKLGKSFLNQLLELEPDNIVPYYLPFAEEGLSLLAQVQKAVLNFEHTSQFKRSENDDSLQIHVCHSKMREVEVLHNQLLYLFERYPDLSPKDIIVMSADIDSYAPYIEAVFSRYDRHDRRHIPFTLSDRKPSAIDPIISGFLTLLSLKEHRFNVDAVLELFNIQSVRAKYQLGESDLDTLREWIQAVGIRAGLAQDNPSWQNYNSWENGLNRLLLGTSMKAENSPWQEIVAFDESYGLSAERLGSLVKFIEILTAWQTLLQQAQTIDVWQGALTGLIEAIYQDDPESSESILALHHAITQISEQITATHFDQPIEIEILLRLFEQHLNEQRSHLNFMVGKVNFCTLLPMRAIPFKVVCLLGMNEGDFPRQEMKNSFDLMQYARQKGDRIKRDDDRYLFLEALLSAQQIFYLSYVGLSLTDTQVRLPSILASQLIDYLDQNLGDKQQAYIQRHPMTVFSPANFRQGYISYDKEWLNAGRVRRKTSPFLTCLSQESGELLNEVSLADLTNYLQAPLRFFFHRQLGVKFEQYERRQEESEIFQLDNLARYDFFDELLRQKDDCLTDYFEIAKLKGNLPACHFGELSAQELANTIQPLREALSEYLEQTPNTRELALPLQLNGQTITLYATLNHCFGNACVLWRAGGLRDKDRIRAWLIFLLTQAIPSAGIVETRFYFRDKASLGCLGFAPIAQAEAQALLARYVQDYLSSFTQLKWALTEGIANYIKKAGESSDDFSLLESELNNSDDPYIQRILRQSVELNLAEIHQCTLDWFSLMITHQKEKE